MKSVLDNPFRVVGLLSGASADEQDRQIKRFRQYAGSKEVIEDDFSFPFLGNLNRSVENFNSATSRLNFASDRIEASLFWFVLGSQMTDEPAFDALKEGKFDTAAKIWNEITQSGMVTRTNYSAYHNLSTLYLSGISIEKPIPGTLQIELSSEDIIFRALFLKLKFLESDFFSEFKYLVANEICHLSNADAQLMFLGQILSEIEGGNSNARKNFIESVINLDFISKVRFLSDFAERLNSRIKYQIERTTAKRRNEKHLGDDLGECLFKDTKEDLCVFKVVRGASSWEYISSADNLANEMLQCSIDYYNFYRNNNSGHNFVGRALSLANKAFEIAVGTVVRERISDTLNVYEKMKDYEISNAIEILQQIRDTKESYSKLSSRTKINWSKVVDTIIRTIPRIHITQIRSVKDSSKQREYKELVDFVMGNLNTIQYLRVSYISYWKAKNIGDLAISIIKTIFNLAQDIIILFFRILFSFIG